MTATGLPRRRGPRHGRAGNDADAGRRAAGRARGHRRHRRPDVPRPDGRTAPAATTTSSTRSRRRTIYRLAAALAGVRHGERPTSRREVDAPRSRDSRRSSTRLAKRTRGDRGAGPRAVLAERRGGSRGAAAAAPVAAWDFRASRDDRVGKLHAQPSGGATLDAARAACSTARPASPHRRRCRATCRRRRSKRGCGSTTSTSAAAASSACRRPTAACSTRSSSASASRAAGWPAATASRRTQAFGGPDEKRRRPTSRSTSRSPTPPTARSPATATASRTASRTRSERSGRVRGGQGGRRLRLRHEPAGGNKMLAGTIVRGPALRPGAVGRTRSAASAGEPGVRRPTPRSTRSSPPTSARSARDAAHGPRRLAAELDRRPRASRTRRLYAVDAAAAGRDARCSLRGNLADARRRSVAPGGRRGAAGPAADFGLAAERARGRAPRKLADWITRPGQPAVRPRHRQPRSGTTTSAPGSSRRRTTSASTAAGLASRAARLARRASSSTRRLRASKAMHRLIVTSRDLPPGVRAAPGRRSRSTRTTACSGGRSRMRLEGEAVRDAMLAVAGPAQPRGRRAGLHATTREPGRQRHRVLTSPFDPVGPEFDRRSIYRIVPRGGEPGPARRLRLPRPLDRRPAPGRARRRRSRRSRC